MWLGKNFPSRQVSLSLGNRKYIALRKQIKSNQNRKKWQGQALRARSGALKIRKNVTNKQTNKLGARTLGARSRGSKNVTYRQQTTDKKVNTEPL